MRTNILKMDIHPTKGGFFKIQNVKRGYENFFDYFILIGNLKKEDYDVLRKYELQ